MATTPAELWSLALTRSWLSAEKFSVNLLRQTTHEVCCAASAEKFMRSTPVLPCCGISDRNSLWSKKLPGYILQLLPIGKSKNTLQPVNLSIKQAPMRFREWADVT